MWREGAGLLGYSCLGLPSLLHKPLQCCLRSADGRSWVQIQQGTASFDMHAFCVQIFMLAAAANLLRDSMKLARAF